jgi:RNA recognition motif. (a.k.a. RRM, RBD, or RNP domain)
LVDDAERDKSRGFFAYAEFEDPQAALAAIRNMNDYELNGRRLRVDLAMRPIWKRWHGEQAGHAWIYLSANANLSSLEALSKAEM